MLHASPQITESCWWFLFLMEWLSAAAVGGWVTKGGKTMDYILVETFPPKLGSSNGSEDHWKTNYNYHIMILLTKSRHKMALASSIISRADYKRPWLRGERALSMTTRLHNFIVTEMGGFFVCCHGKMPLLQGLADFIVRLCYVAFVCLAERRFPNK